MEGVEAVETARGELMDRACRELGEKWGRMVAGLPAAGEGRRWEPRTEATFDEGRGVWVVEVRAELVEAGMGEGACEVAGISARRFADELVVIVDQGLVGAAAGILEAGLAELWAVAEVAAKIVRGTDPAELNRLVDELEERLVGLTGKLARVR